MDEIDLIAYTRGPGMSGCLAQGAASAKTLAAAFRKPVMGIHHMVRVLTFTLLLPSHLWQCGYKELMRDSSKLMHLHRYLRKIHLRLSHS
jgi:hypothetical protein